MTEHQTSLVKRLGELTKTRRGLVLYGMCMVGIPAWIFMLYLFAELQVGIGFLFFLLVASLCTGAMWGWLMSLLLPGILAGVVKRAKERKGAA
jgi:hypothetical protein